MRPQKPGSSPAATLYFPCGDSARDGLGTNPEDDLPCLPSVPWSVLWEPIGVARTRISHPSLLLRELDGCPRFALAYLGRKWFFRCF